MAERSPAYSWYPRDWFASESFHLLSLDAQGAYRNLLDHAWEKDGLPSDPRVLQKLAGASPSQWKHIWPALAHLFQAGPDGRLRNARQEVERAKQRERSSSASGSARKRWQSGRGPNGKPPESGRTAEAMRSHSERSADAMPTKSERNADGMHARAFTSSSSISISDPSDDDTHVGGRKPPTGDVVSSTTSSANRGGPEQLAVLELVASWNRIRTSANTVAMPMGPKAYQPLVHAVRRRSLDAWEATFRLVEASDYLAGRLDLSGLTLWDAIDRAEVIDAGKYATRKPAPPTPTAPTSLIDDAALERVAAAALGPRKGRAS